VFSFLVIPAVIATLFADRISVRLAIGWTVGIAACLIGLVASYRFDMPSGPTVVSSLGTALILAALVYYIRSAERRGNAILRTSAGVLAVGGVLAGLAILLTSGEILHIEHEHDWEAETHAAEGHQHSSTTWHELAVDCRHDPPCIASRLQERGDWESLVDTQLSSSDVIDREEAVDVLVLLDHPHGLDPLARAVNTEPDNLLKLKGTRLLIEAGDRRGLAAALEFLERDAPMLYRDEAHQLLVEHTEQDFGYDPFRSAEENADAIARWREWIAE
jgi:hypothetical protein